jgi:hypothetical protein
MLSLHIPRDGLAVNVRENFSNLLTALWHVLSPIRTAVSGAVVTIHKNQVSILGSSLHCIFERTIPRYDRPIPLLISTAFIKAIIIFVMLY